jgi:outer membrane receptor protein involved in Fe transport
MRASMIFMLTTATIPLPTAEVVVVRAERLQEQRPIGLSINEQALQAQAGTRLDEALRVVPGVGTFRRTSSGAANATIQGLSLRPIAPNGAGRALVSLDGVPQNDPFGGWINWGRYDPLFIERIEIQRGAVGVGYGPMALTGALDLTEARGKLASVTASLGSLGSQHIAGRGSLQSKGAIFTAMGAYDASDGAVAVSPRQRGAGDEPVDFQTLSLALVTDIARSNGAWSFRASIFDESKSAGVKGGQSRAQGVDVSIARRIENEWGQGRLVMFGQGRDFSNQTVTLGAGRALTTPALDQFATPSSALGGSLVFMPAPDLGLPRLNLDWRHAEGETRELFRYVGRDFTRARIAGGSQDWIGLGIAVPRPILLLYGHLRLDGAMRIDHWANLGGQRVERDRATGVTTLVERAKDKQGTVFTGRFSIGQGKGPVQLSFYRTFRPPSLNELHRPFRVGNDVTEANSDLKPEILEGVDLDLRDERDFYSGTLSSSLTVYLNRLHDPIANVTIGIGPGTFARVGFLPVGGSVRERRNVGNVDALGLEFNLNWKGEKRGPSWTISATTTDARVDGAAALPQLIGKRPAQAPRWSAIASATLPMSEAVELSMSFRGESARFDDDLNTRKLAAYGTFDFRATWQLSRRTQAFLSAENLSDTAIATAKAGDGVISFAQGRVVRLGLKFTQ